MSGFLYSADNETDCGGVTAAKIQLSETLCVRYVVVIGRTVDLLAASSGIRTPDSSTGWLALGLIGNR